MRMFEKGKCFIFDWCFALYNLWSENHFKCNNRNKLYVFLLESFPQFRYTTLHTTLQLPALVHLWTNELMEIRYFTATLDCSIKCSTFHFNFFCQKYFITRWSFIYIEKIMNYSIFEMYSYKIFKIEFEVNIEVYK